MSQDPIEPEEQQAFVAHRSASRSAISCCSIAPAFTGPVFMDGYHALLRVETSLAPGIDGAHHSTDRRDLLIFQLFLDGCDSRSRAIHRRAALMPRFRKRREWPERSARSALASGSSIPRAVGRIAMKFRVNGDSRPALDQVSGNLLGILEASKLSRGN
jgi:hypothetical protein